MKKESVLLSNDVKKLTDHAFRLLVYILNIQEKSNIILPLKLSLSHTQLESISGISHSQVVRGMKELRQEKFIDPIINNEISYVYIIQYGNIVKIGKTQNVAKRFNILASNHPDKIELLFSTTETDNINEYLLHKKFKSFRLQNEFFTFSNEIKEFIEKQL